MVARISQNLTGFPRAKCHLVWMRNNGCRECLSDQQAGARHRRSWHRNSRLTANIISSTIGAAFSFAARGPGSDRRHRSRLLLRARRDCSSLVSPSLAVAFR
jgi:hypothetical protein